MREECEKERMKEEKRGRWRIERKQSEMKVKNKVIIHKVRQNGRTLEKIIVSWEPEGRYITVQLCSLEKQNGVIYSVENQKGAITLDFVQR